MAIDFSIATDIAAAAVVVTFGVACERTSVELKRCARGVSKLCAVAFFGAIDGAVATGIAGAGIKGAFCAAVERATVESSGGASGVGQCTSVAFFAAINGVVAAAVATGRYNIAGDAAERTAIKTLTYASTTIQIGAIAGFAAFLHAVAT